MLHCEQETLFMVLIKALELRVDFYRFLVIAVNFMLKLITNLKPFPATFFFWYFSAPAKDLFGKVTAPPLPPPTPAKPQGYDGGCFLLPLVGQID